MVKGAASSDGRFGFNLDGHVGKGQSNKLDDVQFVQFGFHCLSKDTGAQMSPAQRAIYGNVKPGAPFTGAPVDPLCIAIATHQQAKGGTQDGVVSALPQNVVTTYGGGHHRTLSYLLASIYVATADIWPRIDRHPACPPGLKTAVQKCARLL